MTAIREYAPLYGCEKFTAAMPEVVVVEPQRKGHHIYGHTKKNEASKVQNTNLPLSIFFVFFQNTEKFLGLN